MSTREHNRKPSRRQQQVIKLVAKGLKNHEIAKQLGIGPNVVKNYLGIIYDKIGLSNRVELALWYEARAHEGRAHKDLVCLRSEVKTGRESKPRPFS